MNRDNNSHSAPAAIIDIDVARRRRSVAPTTDADRYAAALALQKPQVDLPEGLSRESKKDLITICLFARQVRAEHDAESARINFARHLRGIERWWDGPEDIRERIHANNHLWNLYRGALQRLAAMPALTRAQAEIKRNTIGKFWLKPSTKGEWYDRLRKGCAQDDHLLPPA